MAGLRNTGNKRLDAPLFLSLLPASLSTWLPSAHSLTAENFLLRVADMADPEGRSGMWADKTMRDPLDEPWTQGRAGEQSPELDCLGWSLNSATQ